MAEEIIIFSGNISNHELELSDGGHTEAEKGKAIKWEITEDKTNVASIENIQRKYGDIIFEKPPKKENSKKWKAKIKQNATVGDKYTYSITWKDTSGNEHTHDPIISIKPSPLTSPWTSIIILLVSTVFGLFALKFLRRYRR